MLDVFSHPLGPVPYELASADSIICKNNKSSLGLKIMKNVPLTITILSP